MSAEYLVIKLIHIVTSTFIFGTGIGSAYYLSRAVQSRSSAVIASVTKNVVFADWVFTTPAVILQPLTGFIMIFSADWPLTSPWLLTSIVLYVLVGMCWLPVVKIQIRMNELASTAAENDRDIDEEFGRLMRIWYALGVPAFTGTLAIFYLMVVKPALW